MKAFILVYMIWELTLKFIAAHFFRLSNFILFPAVILSFLGIAVKVEPNLVFFNAIIHLLFYVMFAVSWHNFILAPEGSRTLWQYMKWDRNKLRYLGCFLLLLFVMGLAMNIAVRPGLWLLHAFDYLSLHFHGRNFIENIPSLDWGWIDLLALGAFLGLCFPLSRLMFILPLAAVGKGDIFRRSLVISGHLLLFCFVLFVSLLLFQLVYGFMGIIFRYVFVDIWGDSYWSLLLVSELFLHFYNYFTCAFLVTALSFGYDILSRS